jgi:hypothetical protein
VPDWSLQNVEDAARADPRSFFIPDLAERCSQSVGDEVRLHFLLTAEGPDLPGAERMWVDIVEKSGKPPRYVGVLTNQPVHIRDLKVGDRVAFGPEHIARTIIKGSDPRWFEAAELRAFVSRKVFEDGEMVRWMYREAVDRDDDSGWRLFAGSETDEYVGDSENMRICLVGWLIDWDPTLLPAIRAEVGAAFEREAGAQARVAVTDWDAPEE